MTSNIDSRPHEDHLRFLLDQRTARAHIPGRFPSQSDFSDSPSLYSHAHFSPRSQSFDIQDNDFSTPSSSIYPSHSRMNSADIHSPHMSDRERLNYPDASTLDLEDDARSPYDYGTLHEEDEDTSGEQSDPTDEDFEEHRVSAYGPKMTVHSRAPWETGEEDDNNNDNLSSSLFKKRSNDKSQKSDHPKRTWGLVSRTSTDARPSMESLRSQTKPKHSFETASSLSSNGGALLALAQASMSSTSLGMAPSPQSSLRDKLSLPRLRSRTTSNTRVLSKLEPIDTRPMTPNAPSFPLNASPMSRLRATSPSDSVFSRIDSRQTISGPPSPHTPLHEYTHPYANPELVRDFPTDLPSQQHLDELHALAHSPSHFSPHVGRSDSNATLTDTNTTVSQSSSITTTSSTSLTPVTSMSSMQSKNDCSLPSPRSPFIGKSISAPMSVNKASIRTLPGTIHMSGTPSSATSINNKRDTKLLPGVPVGVPGWGESSGGKTIKLISLEEAQARERTRSATVNASSGTMSPTSNRPVDYEPLPSPSTQSSGWSRMRSTSSSSSRPKNLPTPPALDLNQFSFPAPPDGATTPSDHGSITGVPTKGIVRKKSGFMRLFNGKERSPPPPMPMISTSVVVSPSPVLAARKGSTHRVPVPSITPSLLEPPDSAGSHSSSGDSRSDRDSPSSSLPSRAHSSASARKNVHGLSIVTKSSVASFSDSKSLRRSASPSASDATHIPVTPTTAPSSSEGNPSYNINNNGSSNNNNNNHLVPNSAPPGSAEFIALKLRPVSTMFSSGFSEEFVDRNSGNRTRPSLESADSGTPTTATSTSATSPLSPAFTGVGVGVGVGPQSRTSEDKSIYVSIAPHQDDQSTVIQALQEQIATSRRAWQRQIWELEGQVRDLKAEVEELRNADSRAEYCVACGRGNMGRPSGGSGSDGESRVVEDLKKAGVRVGGVVNRPRARTGVGSRFASGT